MTADHWTHHDPAVRALIRAAQAEAWDEGRDAVASFFLQPVNEIGLREPIVNPYREAAR